MGYEHNSTLVMKSRSGCRCEKTKANRIRYWQPISERTISATRASAQYAENTALALARTDTSVNYASAVNQKDSPEADWSRRF